MNHLSSLLKPSVCFKKATAFVVVFTFIVTNHFSLQPLYAQNEISDGLAVANLDLNQLRIPSNIGKLEESWVGDKNKVVVLVQDAHAIPEAQKNIRNIIDFLNQRHGVSHVAIEGAASKLNTQIFRSFPDPELLKSVFAEYLHRGDLTGATMASVFNQNESSYEGIEDWKLYEEGYSYYLEATRQSEMIKAKLKEWDLELEELKTKMYSPSLKKVDETLRAFRADQKDLIETIKALAEIKAPQKDNEIDLVLQESVKNSNANVSVEKEVDLLAKKVKKVLSMALGSTDLFEKKMVFNEKYQSYQTGRITAEDFALFLTQFAGESDLPIQLSRELQLTVKKQKRIKDIEGTRFFDQFEAYIAEVKEHLFQNEKERVIDQESRKFELVEKLNDLESTQAQWLEFKEVLTQQRRSSKKFLNEIDSASSYFDSLLPLLKFHILFYNSAEQRDHVFAKKLKEMLDRQLNEGESLRSAIFVAGGFHTEGLLKLFKEEGISYALVTPSINGLPDEIHYKDQMQGKVSWSDYFEIEKGKINVYEAFVRSTRDRLMAQAGDDAGKILKRWRDQIIRDLAEKNTLNDSEKYTTFIDEVAEGTGYENPQLKLKKKVDEMLDRLSELESNNQLTQKNIMSVLKPSTIQSLFVMPASTTFSISFDKNGIPVFAGIDVSAAIAKITMDGVRYEQSQTGGLFFPSNRSELRSTVQVTYETVISPEDARRNYPYSSDLQSSGGVITKFVDVPLYIAKDGDFAIRVHIQSIDSGMTSGPIFYSLPKRDKDVAVVVEESEPEFEILDRASALESIRLSGDKFVTPSVVEAVAKNLLNRNVDLLFPSFIKEYAKSLDTDSIPFTSHIRIRGQVFDSSNSYNISSDTFIAMIANLLKFDARAARRMIRSHSRLNIEDMKEIAYQEISAVGDDVVTADAIKKLAVSARGRSQSLFLKSWTSDFWGIDEGASSSPSVSKEYIGFFTGDYYVYVNKVTPDNFVLMMAEISKFDLELARTIVAGFNRSEMRSEILTGENLDLRNDVNRFVSQLAASQGNGLLARTGRQSLLDLDLNRAEIVDQLKSALDLLRFDSENDRYSEPADIRGLSEISQTLEALIVQLESYVSKGGDLNVLFDEATIEQTQAILKGSKEGLEKETGVKESIDRNVSAIGSFFGEEHEITRTLKGVSSEVLRDNYLTAWNALPTMNDVFTRGNSVKESKIDRTVVLDEELGRTMTVGDRVEVTGEFNRMLSAFSDLRSSLSEILKEKDIYPGRVYDQEEALAWAKDVENRYRGPIDKFDPTDINDLARMLGDEFDRLGEDLPANFNEMMSLLEVVNRKPRVQDKFRSELRSEILTGENLERALAFIGQIEHQTIDENSRLYANLGAFAALKQGLADAIQSGIEVAQTKGQENYPENGFRVRKNWLGLFKGTHDIQLTYSYTMSDSNDVDLSLVGSFNRAGELVKISFTEPYHTHITYELKGDEILTSSSFYVRKYIGDSLSFLDYFLTVSDYQYGWTTPRVNKTPLEVLDQSSKTVDPVDAQIEARSEISPEVKSAADRVLRAINWFPVQTPKENFNLDELYPFLDWVRDAGNSASSWATLQAMRITKNDNFRNEIQILVDAVVKDDSQSRAEVIESLKTFFRENTANRSEMRALTSEQILEELQSMGIDVYRPRPVGNPELAGYEYDPPISTLSLEGLRRHLGRAREWAKQGYTEQISRDAMLKELEVLGIDISNQRRTGNPELAGREFDPPLNTLRLHQLKPHLEWAKQRYVGSLSKEAILKQLIKIGVNVDKPQPVGNPELAGYVNDPSLKQEKDVDVLRRHLRKAAWQAGSEVLKSNSIPAGVTTFTRDSKTGRFSPVAGARPVDATGTTLSELREDQQISSDLETNNSRSNKKINLALSSGGIAGIPAHIGFLSGTEAQGVKIDRIAGTSAGALVGVLRAAGYSSDELEKLFAEADFKKYLVKINPLLPTFLHPLIYGAIYKTDEAEEWINSLLKSKLGSSSEFVTFRELAEKGISFRTVSTNIKAGGTQVLDEFITPDMSVAKATVMSMSIPLIFRSHEIGDNEILINAETNTFLPRGIYSDGAIRNGLPIAAFSNELADGQNVVGFYLKKNHLEVEEIISQIPNFALRTIMGYLLNHPFFRDLSYSIKSLLSHYYNPKDAKGKIYIVEGNISASLLNDSVITADERAGLKSVGSKAAENFFPTIFKDFKDVRSELRSFDDGSTIISTDIGLEKWNVTNAKQRLLSLSEGTHEIDGFIEQLNFDLRNQRGQVFTAEVINTLIAAIQARMPHVGLTVDGNVVTVAPQREKQINFLSLEQGLDQFEGRKKVFIGGPSNVMSDYRPSIPTIRALLENLQKNDPNVVIVLGTTAFGYGQQAAKIAKELGLTTVSVLPRNHGVWASPSDIDFHVTGGIDWTGRHYYEAISAFADAIFTVEGFGGTRKEFQAFRDAGKKAFRIRTDLTAEENNLEDHAKLALDPNASATEINTAAEWGALSQADALNQVRVRYAAKINSALESDSAVSSVDFMRDYYSQLGKKDKTVQHQARQDILSAYGLLNADGSLNYDAFYSEIILNASNQDKNAWLKDYEAVVAFIDEIEYRITKDEVRDFAFAIHDGGYWLDRLKEIQSTIISEPGHLLLGRIPQFQSQAEENEFLSYLNAEGQKAYASRFENAGGYKLTLAHLEENKRLEFYQKYGSLKDQASLKAYLDSGKFNAAKVQVFNANAGSWNDLLGDVAFFDNLTPAEASRLASLESRDAKEAYLEEIGKTSRLSAIRSNQTGGMASAFALKNIKSKSLKFAEIDYATAVIWRYKGHWSGLNAFEEVYQVNTDYYSNEFDADRLKDGPIWQAVLDRELELQGITNENERFLQVVVRRTDNQSALDYKSSDDAMQKMIAPVREQVRQDFKSDPEKMARLALVSHDLGYWPDQKNNIANPSHAALGRAPDLEGEQLQKFKSFLTSDGQTLYETRFAKPSGYKLLVKHVKEDQRENFYQFMAELYQLDKSELIGNIGSLKEGTQVFNANYGSWEDLEKDISKFDAESGDGSRIAQMLENQISNIIMTRILSSTDSFLTGMQMSHAMAILWRYVVADYKGIRAYDGKDKFGQYDPKWKHDGSEQVRTNYYNPAFAEDRGKDFEMWSSLLIELARIDGKTENAAVTEQVVRRSSNESEIAWQSTMRPIVKRVDEVEASITQEDLAKFAPGVHNNGYWAKEKSKIGTVENPSSDSLLGSHLDVQGLIENAFHPEARKWWDGKHTKSVIDEYNALSNEEKQNLKVKFGVVRLGTKGYQFNGAIFKNEAARKQFYASLPNKTASAVEGSATAVILNENAMSFENAWKEADLYKGADAEDRKSRLYGNQKGAIATALVLADTEGLSLEEMAYLTAVIWRYKGHWSGDKGYQSEWQVSRDYLMGLDRAEREKDVSILLAVLEILGKAAPISRGRLDDGAVATDLLDKDGLPLDIETDLDLQLQDRVYLKIDGKWYAGTITDYRGDGLLDGRYSKEGYWQISGYMVKLDGQVPGWALPLNNLFLTNEDLNNERKKEQLTERVVFKISKADSNNDLAILDTVSVGRAALRESLSSRIEERVFRSEMRMSSLSSSDLNFLMQREWAVAGGVFFRYGFEEAYEALSAKHVGVFKDVVLAVSADEATGRASITVSLATDSQAPLTATQNAFATELTGLLQQFSDHLGSTAATAILTRQVTRQDSNVPADNNAMWSTVRLDFSPRNELRSRGDAVLADFKKLGFEKKLLDDKALKFTSIERVDMLSMEAAIRSIVDLGDDTIDAREVFDILSLVLTQDILKYFTIGTSFEALRGIALDLLSSKTVQNPVFYSKGRLQLVFAALISLRDLGKMIDLSRNTSSEEYIILLDKARSAVPMPDIRLAILAESNTVLKEREVAFRKDLLYKNDYDVILDYIRKSIPVEDGPAVIEAVLALEEQIKPFKGQMAFKVNPLTPLLTPIPGDSDAVIHAKLILSAKKNRGGTSVMNPNAYILGVDFDLKKALSNYFDPTIPERFKQTPQDAVALEKLGSFLSAMEQAVTQGQLPSYYSRAIDELRRRISAGVGLAEATVDLQTLLEKNIFPRQSNGYTEPPTQKDLAEAQRANDSRVTWLANFHDAVRSEMRDFKTSEEAIDYALKTPNNNWDWRREPSTKKVMALSLIEGSSVDANKAREILAVALKNNIYDGKIPDGTRAALNFALASVQGDFEEANLTRRAIAFALGTLSGDDSAGREGYDASLKALGDALIDSFRSRTIGASDAFETLAAAIASVPSDNASDAVVNELTESLIEILSNSNLSESNADSTASALANIDRDVNEKTGLLILDRLVEVQGNSRESNQRRANFAASLNPTLTLDNYINAIFSNSANVDLAISKILETLSKINQTQEDSMGRGYSAIGKTIALFLALEHGGLLEALSASQRVRIKTALENVLTNKFDVVLSDDQHYRNSKWVVDEVLKLLADIEKSALEKSDQVALQETQPEELKGPNEMRLPEVELESMRHSIYATLLNLDSGVDFYYNDSDAQQYLSTFKTRENSSELVDDLTQYLDTIITRLKEIEREPYRGDAANERRTKSAVSRALTDLEGYVKRLRTEETPSEPAVEAPLAMDFNEAVSEFNRLKAEGAGNVSVALWTKRINDTSTISGVKDVTISDDGNKLTVVTGTSEFYLYKNIDTGVYIVSVSRSEMRLAELPTPTIPGYSADETKVAYSMIQIAQDVSDELLPLGFQRADIAAYIEEKGIERMNGLFRIVFGQNPTREFFDQKRAAIISQLEASFGEFEIDFEVGLIYPESGEATDNNETARQAATHGVAIGVSDVIIAGSGIKSGPFKEQGINIRVVKSFDERLPLFGSLKVLPTAVLSESFNANALKDKFPWVQTEGIEEISPLASEHVRFLQMVTVGIIGHLSKAGMTGEELRKQTLSLLRTVTKSDGALMTQGENGFSIASALVDIQLQFEFDAYVKASA